MLEKKSKFMLCIWSGFFFFYLGNGRSLASGFDQATVLGERYEMIWCVADERWFNNDSYSQRFGITVDNNEMLLLLGRIWPSSEIKYEPSQGD